MSDDAQRVNPPVHLFNQDPERLRAARKAAGYSLVAACKATGVDKSSLSKAENGLSGIGWNSLFDLADLYGCRVEDLEPERRVRPQQAAA